MLLVKICLLGEAAVGKTSLRRVFLGERFDSSYLITIGADFAVKTVEMGSETIRYQVWDLAGQAKFSNVRDLYYRGSLGALIVFDITRPDTLQVLDSWIEELFRSAGKGPVPIIILGNKTDLRDECDDPVDKETIDRFVISVKEKYDTQIDYLDTSAKEGLNVGKAFMQLGNMIIEDTKMYLIE
ncbi:MAG: Rab family GTPase [Candidatus Hodarchaeales archaeon]|jgi:small GTP-binding protein